MKNIFLSILLLLTVSVCKAQYNPSNFTVSNKAYGVAQAVPTDARSFYYDGSLFVMRPYQSTAEVLSYLNLTKYRIGNFPIYVNVGGTLQSGGTFTGGTITEYWFRDGTADGNLVAKLVPETDPKRVTGVAITGTTTKTVTITLADASTVTGTFTDLSGASTPTLQQVSDVGHTTTTDITANNFRGASVILNSNGGGGVSTFTNTDGDLNINYGKDGGNVVLAKGTTGTFRDTITKSGTIAMISDLPTGGATWGSITGTLSSQTDLQTALNAKLNITDTAAMLSNYSTIAKAKQIVSDTATANAIYVDTATLGQGTSASKLRSKLTITTTGTSGAATLTGNTLNIPQYAGTATTSATIDTSIAQWFRTLPGWIGDGSTTLRDNFTWVTAGVVQTQLAAPTLTTGTATASTIPLSWSSVTNATGYNLYKSTDNANFTSIYSGSSTSYTATGLPLATAYYFRINATATGYTTSNWGTSTGTTTGINIDFPTVANIIHTGTVWEGTAATFSTNLALSNSKLAAGQDGYVQQDYVATDARQGALGFDLQNTNADKNMEAAIYVDAAGKFAYAENGVYTSSATTVAIGSTIRLRRAGSVLTAELSTDGGVTFPTTLRTYTFSSSADLFIRLYAGGAVKIYNPKGVNLQ